MASQKSWAGGALVLFVLAVLLVAISGCGDETETVTTAADDTPGTNAASTRALSEPECDLEAASIIPEPSGRPQHVYFYRDT